MHNDMCIADCVKRPGLVPTLVGNEPTTSTSVPASGCARFQTPSFRDPLALPCMRAYSILVHYSRDVLHESFYSSKKRRALQDQDPGTNSASCAFPASPLRC
jgi:hypothetical protein